ncbi:BZ3500_MvSof-1268-A1-R1_Chr12-3g04014 [Microbotryum saponariae]|uniref:BZ3500_MvSof-1268-A1-R1_Chr12-3g04014 protein n=1 Tax=Microbotryum saponariae TaxID=289078 RepID=A0A2X0KR48_9BASI|nr:BZ3500_MvSof-1268-A1-R1_Chr12-3g04014 [Microbotryum saponariae]SDA02541.1 BZ3501_MvSof-1269-A2-R1_Chr12-3g03669 [Microbotryum saponariae]
MLQAAFVLAWREGTVSQGTSTLIGVAICVAGNTCVSLALNVQKLAHTRLERRHRNPSAPSSSPSPLNKPDQDHQPTIPTSGTPSNPIGEHTHLLSELPPPTQLERSISDPEISDLSPNLLHLLPRSDPRAPPSLAAGPPTRPTNELRKHSSRTIYFNGNRPQSYGTVSHTRSDPAEQPDPDEHDPDPAHPPRTDKEFIKSPLWLLGFSLLALGEFGNFLSYSFAPASLVAPLGSVALVANVGLAPLICGEPFRKRDLFGCALAAMGAVTIVWASKAQDKLLYPPEMVAAISTPLFLAYSIASIAAIAVLVVLSRSKYGDRYVMIDLGICALSGAFTVLSTKAISSFLNILFLQTFEYWITYPLLLVLAGSAMLQINFINKALQRFDSRVVIPIQFTSFALSTIGRFLIPLSVRELFTEYFISSYLAPVGSAVLYREFDGVDLSSFFNFIFGCVICGAGVYLLTGDAPSEENHSEEEGKSHPTYTNASHATQTYTPSTPLDFPHPISLEVPSIIDPSSLTSTSRFGSLGHSPTKALKQASRKLSLTLGGTQYLLARSPGSMGLISGGGGGGGRNDLEEGGPETSRSFSAGRS